MSRNLVICCDGTDNQFGPENTNVVRLAQMLDRNPSKQLLYYDPGVGTLPEPSAFSWFSKKVSEVFGLAFGAGLSWKVREAYTFLMRFWEPGDQVFIIGFSRGAYTARVLAGMLHAVGLLPRGNDNLVPYAFRIFKAMSTGHRSERGEQLNQQAKDLCDGFRWSFARVVSPTDTDRRFPVHFLGLWDTVSSVGWVWDPKRFPYTAHNPSISTIRHAIAIDERRWFFRQNRIFPATPTQDLQEHWFAGVHCDVGGGYSEKDGGLWRVALDWIVSEAKTAGLLLDVGREQEVLSQSPVSPHPYDDFAHESLTWAWWPCEFFPKLQWQPDKGRQVLSVGLGRYRPIEDGALIHWSALKRIRDLSSYRPRNVSPAFVESIRSLRDVPLAVGYSKDGRLIVSASELAESNQDLEADRT